MVNLNYISPLPRSPTPDRVWGTGKDPYPPPFTPIAPLYIVEWAPLYIVEWAMGGGVPRSSAKPMLPQRGESGKGDESPPFGSAAKHYFIATKLPEVWAPPPPPSAGGCSIEGPLIVGKK
jgi:hypothetical protein